MIDVRCKSQDAYTMMQTPSLANVVAERRLIALIALCPVLEDHLRRTSKSCAGVWDLVAKEGKKMLSLVLAKVNVGTGH